MVVWRLLAATRNSGRNSDGWRGGAAYGAGLVRVLTRGENIAPLLTARPELMVHELTPQSLEESLTRADVVVIGPGLGQQEWGKKPYRK